VGDQRKGRGSGSDRGAKPDGTKAEKKEYARLERERIHREMAKRKRTRTIGLVLVVLAVAVVALVLVLAPGDEAPSTASPTASGSAPAGNLPDPATLAGILRTPPPWDNNTAELPQRLEVLQLPGLSDVVLHHHADLLIFVNGDPVTVPADIGLVTAASPLHTHTDTGTVHVEADDPTFQPVLGQFFDVWGVYFTAECLGGDCASGDTAVRAFVDGKPWTGDPTQIPIDDQSVIVVTIGTQAQVPDPIPTTFTLDGEPAA
jgi:hypothetical protein